MMFIPAHRTGSSYDRRFLRVFLMYRDPQHQFLLHMPIPRVYADFNAIEYCGEGSHAAEMALTGYGTLASLAGQGIRLTEGMTLLLFEPMDIECEATAHFDVARKDPAARIGAWVGRIADHRNIRDCTEPSETSRAHPCIVCSHDFFAHQKIISRTYTEICACCGASVMAPMAPPDTVA